MKFSHNNNIKLIKMMLTRGVKLPTDRKILQHEYTNDTINKITSTAIEAINKMIETPTQENYEDVLFTVGLAQDAQDDAIGQDNASNPRLENSWKIWRDGLYDTNEDDYARIIAER